MDLNFYLLHKSAEIYFKCKYVCFVMTYKLTHMQQKYTSDPGEEEGMY